MVLLRSLLLLGAAALAVHGADAGMERPRFFLGLAFTAGGDTLVSAHYTDGSSSSVKAGGETHVKAGIDWRANAKFSFQASVGYHTDSTKDAKNGGATFKRVPIEGLGYYHLRERIRLGVGLRKATDATLSGQGSAGNSVGSIDFDSSTGFIVECNWLSQEFRYGHGGLALRHVTENYTPSGFAGAPSIDGSHFGIGVTWTF